MIKKEKSIVIQAIAKQEERLIKIESLLTSSKKVLNIEGASDLTGLSKSTIYKFTYTGRIPYYKQAKHLYFDKDELEKWLLAKKGISSEQLKKQASESLNIIKGGLL